MAQAFRVSGFRIQALLVPHVAPQRVLAREIDCQVIHGLCSFIFPGLGLDIGKHMSHVAFGRVPPILRSVHFGKLHVLCVGGTKSLRVSDEIPFPHNESSTHSKSE